MSDILDLMLQGIPEGVSTKDLSKSKNIVSPILYTSTPNIEDIKYTFLVDKYLSNVEVAVLSKFIDKKVSVGYQILYSLRIMPSEKDLKKTVWRFYYKMGVDLKGFIPEYTKVFSIGKSLFTLTGSNDLDCSLVRDEDSDENSKKKEKLSIIQGFYDTILWKTSFFHPELKCEIFPIDSWEDLIDSDTGLMKDSFELWFFNKQLTIAKSKNVNETQLEQIEIEIVDNPNEFLKKHSDNKEITGYDIETNGLDPWKTGAKIHCLTLSFISNPYKGYYLDFSKVNRFILMSFLKDRPLVGTNIKFDGKFTSYVAKIPLSHFNIYGETVQLQQICNEMMRKGLKAGAWLYTTFGGYDLELDEYLEKHPEIGNDYSKIPPEILIPYATKDPCVSLLVYKALLQYRDALDIKLNRDNPYGYSLKWCYEEIIIPTLNMFLEVELTGMSIEKDVLKQQSEKLIPVVEELRKDIIKELGETDLFNVFSVTQLGKKLESLGWPVTERDKKGIAKTGEPQLINWEKKGYTLATKILKLREQNKLLTTYVGVEKDKSGIYKWIRDDGKLHTQYNNFLALSWRHTSSSPNGQNFVSHGEKAKLSRSFICPYNRDYAFLSTDYSGLQLRLAAMVSDDEEMVRAFKYEGGDIHMRTAYNVMLKYMTNIESIEEAQKIRKGEGEQADYINDMRFKSKAINFGLLFGAQAITVMMESIKPNWTEKEADEYIKANKLSFKMRGIYKDIINHEYSFLRSVSPAEDLLNAKLFTVAIDVREKFFASYQGLLEWIENTRNFAQKNGYVVSVYGAIRRLPYLLVSGTNKKVNYRLFSNYLNIALNSPIQNMEAIVMNRSLVKIHKKLKEEKRRDKIFGQIHDAQEYYIDFTEEKTWKEFVKLVHEINEEDYPEYKGIPLEVESNLADYWGKGQLWDMGTKVNPKKF